MFKNLPFRLIAVAQVLRSKKLLVLFFLFSFFGNLTFAQAPGNTLNFDGTNDYVNLGTTLSFPNTTAFTIEAWASQKIGKGVMVVSKHNAGVDGQYDFMENSDGMISFSREVVPLWLANTAATGFTGNWTAPSISSDTNHILSI